jgi:hypothetical protein
VLFSGLGWKGRLEFAGYVFPFISSSRWKNLHEFHEGVMSKSLISGQSVWYSGCHFLRRQRRESMTSMSRIKPRSIQLSTMILAQLCSLACSRPAVTPATGATSAGPRTGQSALHDHGTNPLPEELWTPGDSREPQSALPFHDAEGIPAGTLLTVRLNKPVTVVNGVMEASFNGEMDAPVIIEGNTLIPKGAAVAGRVESSRVSTVAPNRAYIRLALESVQVGGVDLPIQTASLFASQPPKNNSVIRLDQGRRLTFRLSEPLTFNAQSAEAAH